MVTNLKLASPDALLKIVEQRKKYYVEPPPTRQRGRPRTFSGRVFLLLAVVAVVLLTFKSQELCTLLGKDAGLWQRLGFSRVPHRRTIARRLDVTLPEAEAQVQALRHQILGEVEAAPEAPQALAIDGRMYQAQGPLWHKRDQDQASIGRELDQIAEASREQTVSKDADVPPLTPEEEEVRAQTQIRAQIELLESARRAEPPDPQWAGTAQLALHEAFQSKAVTGMQVGETDCRTTFCRAELLLDSSASPQVISRELIFLAPWQGQSLVHFDLESGKGVIYLAREGHSLP